MTTAVPSRAVLSKWMTAVAGAPVGTAPEKKCSNGALYCQLLDSVKPGLINMTKVNLSADSDHASLANYRVLQQGIEKAGLSGSIDPSLLSKGQPQATLDLLHKLYALVPADQAPRKGLTPLDANNMDNNAAHRGKRRVGAPAPPPAKRPSAQEEQASTANAPATEAPAENAATSMETVLRQQLDQARNDAARARAENSFLVEERDFYMSKVLRARPFSTVCVDPC